MVHCYCEIYKFASMRLQRYLNVSRGDQNNTVKFLTKGDNNSVDDRSLYAPGQLWLTHKDVVGRARGFLPYVGMVTIYMNEYPKFKYTVLACLGLYVLVHRE